MSRCPKSKRGHSWGGRDSIFKTKVEDGNRRTCSACGTHGEVDSQGVTFEIKQ